MLAPAVLCVLALSVPAPPLSTSPTTSAAAAGSARKAADRDPEIADLLDELSDSMRYRPAGRGRDPQRGAELIAELHGRFETCGPHDRADIALQFVRSLERFDRTRPEGREPVLLAANALAGMGPESVEPLLHCVVDDELEEDAELHRRLILSLGRTRDERAVGRLQKLLHHGDAAVQAAAAEALGEFEALEQERRKEVFYTLLGRLLDAKHLVEQDDFDLVARRRYETVVGAMTTSLQRLSRHDERDPDQWLRFWNKNKDADWGTAAP